jgi:hypothetical protein
MHILRGVCRQMPLSVYPGEKGDGHLDSRFDGMRFLRYLRRGLSGRVPPSHGKASTALYGKGRDHHGGLQILTSKVESLDLGDDQLQVKICDIHKGWPVGHEAGEQCSQKEV